MLKVSDNGYKNYKMKTDTSLVQFIMAKTLIKDFKKIMVQKQNYKT